jgi:signal transduction histidine kinase
MKNKLDELTDIDLFKGLSLSELQIVADYCLPRQFRKGEVLFYEKEEADCLYIIIEGEVEIWSDFKTKERDLLAVKNERCIVGEMALIDQLPRSATLIAGTDVDTYFISQVNYEKMLIDCPSIAVILMKSLSLIVRKSNQNYLSTLREQNREIENTYRELMVTQEMLHREEKLSHLGQFASMIIHDIRNPLSVIKSYSELVLKSETGKNRKYLSKILGETTKLNFLVTDLLDFSRGDTHLNYSIIDVNQFISKIINDFEPSLISKDISCVFSSFFDENLIIDRERFERALVNLLNNSRKAVSRGGSINIKTEKNNNLFLLTITDNGCGMDKETLGHVFEPFYSQSGKGGTGLGMVIAKNIIEAHEGYITVESEKEQGTTIKIELPLK